MAKSDFPIIHIDNVGYTESEVRAVMQEAIKNAVGTGKAKTVYRLKRDVVIPSGTEFQVAQNEERRLITPHASLNIAISKDTTMSITMDLEDALNVGLIEKKLTL